MDDHHLLSQLEPPDFYDHQLRAIFLGMCIDHRENGDVQIGSLNIILSKNDRYPGFEWLLRILDTDFQYIADPRTTVRELKKLRAKREAAAFKSSAATAEEIPLEFQSKAKEIHDAISFQVNPMREHVERIKKGVEVIPTGFPTFDLMCGGGLERGGMMVVAGPPGSGKTAFATTLASNFLGQGRKVCYVTLEMAGERIVVRILQAFWHESAERVRAHVDDMMKLPAELFTVAPGQSIEKVLAALASCLEADIFIVDYVQLISSKQTNNYFANQELISNQLKGFAFEHNKVLIVLSQLNRDIERDRRNREPGLSDIRNTSALAQDAHVVAFLWDKNAKEDEAGQEQEESAEIRAKKEKLGMVNVKTQPTTEREKDIRLVIKKNRNGTIGKIYLDFDPTTMRFTEDPDPSFRL
ncbi:MAG: DnaB-like helicase C-terminal domain-containing protein [Candidatus Peribacter sp.]